MARAHRKQFHDPCRRCIKAEAGKEDPRHLCDPCSAAANSAYEILNHLREHRDEMPDWIERVSEAIGAQPHRASSALGKLIEDVRDRGVIRNTVLRRLGIKAPKEGTPAQRIKLTAPKERLHVPKNALKDGQPLLDRAVRMIESGIVPARPIERQVTESLSPKSQPTQQQSDAVTKELAERELARRKLLRFVLRMYPEYKVGWFNIDLCDRLEKFLQDVIDRKSPRLMLSVPPRHGKSFIVSEKFPAWALGRNPSLEFISTSYGQSLANDFSYKVQNLLQMPEYRSVFPDCELEEGRSSIESWRTTKGGQYHAVGAGGPLTGRGAHVLNIDDPIKNREEADSANIRQSLYNWYTSTAYTRLMPGGGVLITQTRWHDDDLMGRLEAEFKVALRQLADTGVFPEDADRWEIISYPAIATQDEEHRKRGDALHPGWMPLGELLKRKRALGPRDWSALYQQNPVPDEGGYFKPGWIRYADTMPKTDTLAIYAAVDLAVSKKETADFTAIVVVGVDQLNNIHVLDLRHGRFDSMEIIDQLFDVWKVWRPRLIGIEEGAIASSIGPFLNKRIQEEQIWEMAIEPLKIRRMDKEARARSIQGRMSQGKVFFPKNAEWTPTLVNELLRFGQTAHDDCVDALAWIGQMLETIVAPEAPTRQKTESWRDKLHKFAGEQESGSWMAA